MGTHTKMWTRQIEWYLTQFYHATACISFAKLFSLSACLSVERVLCDKTKKTCAHTHTKRTFWEENVWLGRPLLPDILCQTDPHERTFNLVFWQKEWLKFWAKLTLLDHNAYFQSIFARSASAVRPSKKVEL